MNTEQLFDRGGYYPFLLESNALLHRQARAVLGELLARRLASLPGVRPLRLLDLACGGAPVTPAYAMGAHAAAAFHYHGVDANADQVAAAQRFAFPRNVERVVIEQADAWDTAALRAPAPFDLVFTGMNLHHGSPERIAALALGMRPLLSAGGLFVSHDVFRPEHTPLLRRGVEGPEPEWRRDYLATMRSVLSGRGGDPAGVLQTIEHMRRWDYPVSASELRGLFEAAGYCVELRRFDKTLEPMAPFVALCTAWRAGTQ